MANATMAEIRAAIALVLTDAYGATWNVSEYLLAKPEPPQMDVTAGPITYDTAMARGSDDLRFIVRAMVQEGLDTQAQANLDGLLDTTSAGAFKTVMEADRTLGGLISALRVESVSELKVLSVTQSMTALPGVEFSIFVMP